MNSSVMVDAVPAQAKPLWVMCPGIIYRCSGVDCRIQGSKGCVAFGNVSNQRAPIVSVMGFPWDGLAEWFKALASGASSKGRRFKLYPCKLNL